jgi:hypothetical protein
LATAATSIDPEQLVRDNRNGRSHYSILELALCETRLHLSISPQMTISS